MRFEAVSPEPEGGGGDGAKSQSARGWETAAPEPLGADSPERSARAADRTECAKTGEPDATTASPTEIATTGSEVARFGEGPLAGPTGIGAAGEGTAPPGGGALGPPPDAQAEGAQALPPGLTALLLASVLARTASMEAPAADSTHPATVDALGRQYTSSDATLLQRSIIMMRSGDAP
jgi:hypothetical protein